MFDIDAVTVTERLLLAAFLGGLVGWEREQRNKQAGFKTHLLVSVGSALIMLTSIYGFGDIVDHPNARFDPARLAAQVVSGIGFLGAGAILRHSNKVISGLTTAATLWVVAAIGLSVGSGFYYPAVATTGIVLLSVVVLRSMEEKWLAARRDTSLEVWVNDQPGKLSEISTFLSKAEVDIRNVMISHEESWNEDEGVPVVLVGLQVRRTSRSGMLKIVEGLKNIEGVHEVNLNRPFKKKRVRKE